MSVEFKDFSFEVKAEINEKTVEWLHTWSNEIASQAKRNCSTDESYSAQLHGSYANKVDEKAGEAHIGSPLEQAFWEEYGTGSYADTSKNGGRKGRQGWWVYKDGYTGKGGKVLTERQAKGWAASDPTVHATNGRRPNYTLEKAFTKTKPKAIADMERLLKEMGK